MTNAERFIEKAILKYGNRFDYDKVKYFNSTTKIKIFCNAHKELFYQAPVEHLRGRLACNYCTRNPKVDTKYFINKAKTIHGDRYDYSKTRYIGSETKVKVICKEHGVFSILPNNHYTQNCPKCSLSIKNKDKISTNELFIIKANKVHDNKYDYSKIKYLGTNIKLNIICPIHGEFQQLPYSHLRGKGCKGCAVNSIKKFFTKSQDDFIIDAKKIHGEKYDYSNIEYKNSKTSINIVCPIHGEFKQQAEYHLSGSGCQKCALLYNKIEGELKDFITAMGIEFVENTRSLIKPYEIDIYIPSLNIAIEFNGLYWHSEIHKQPSYHLTKTELCEENGIQLIHIFEDEWINKKEICKSRLINLMKLSTSKIYARKTFIKNVNNDDAKVFLNENHIQGYVNAKITLGLYYENKLVALTSFGGLRKSLGQSTKEGSYELLRFCTKLNTSVVGGANKLFKYFIENYRPIEIISYADRRWSQGKLYNTLGFEFSHMTKPNYFYIVNGKRENRFKYRKDVLIKSGYDANKSEHQIMLDRGLFRIYDCGALLFRKKLIYFQ